MIEMRTKDAAEGGTLPVGSPKDNNVHRVRVAGVPIDLMDRAMIMNWMDSLRRSKQRAVLANVNLHGLYMALKDPAMGDLLKSRDVAVQIDGMPIVWLARLAGAPARASHRQAHIDLIPELLKHCAKQRWPVVIVGGLPEDVSPNLRALREVAPGLDIQGFEGSFDLLCSGAESRQRKIVDAIRAISPALLLVGMGMPKQERFIAANRCALGANMIMPVGGFADYFAGRTRTPPRWLGTLGLEWAYRLIHDPRRLAGRYLIEPFKLIALLALRTFQGAPWGTNRCA